MCALGAGVPAVVANVAKGKSHGLTENYSKQAFIPYLNSTFFIHGGPLSKFEVVLEKITDHKAARMGSKVSGRESFSLLFRETDEGTQLGQSTYVIEHSKGEQFTLFVVPVGKHDAGLYEVIINTK
jgi:hypothetical protein